MDFNLLLILPDIENQNILITKTHSKYQLPVYDKPIDINIGFDEPQLYNDFFRDLTGISVFRRYSFNTDNYVVFVFEQTGKLNAVPTNEYSWISYREFLYKESSDRQQAIENQAIKNQTIDNQTIEIKNILRAVSCHYNKSVNMPWVSESGFSPYFIWLYEICSAKNIHINGEITQVKNAYVSSVFCIPTDTGNLYMKIPGKISITELPFNCELRKFGLINFPVWVDFNLEMNVFLMKDMTGIDLPPQSNIDTLKKVIIQLARTQKESIPYLPLNCKHYDYRLGTLIKNLNDFPKQAYDILLGTQYRITYEEKEKLEKSTKRAIELLHFVKNKPIPDVIQNGDVRPGNIRVVGDKYNFYDWAWGAVSHPFIEVTTFLHIIRRSLPENIPAKEIIIDAYLSEWLEYGTYDELKRVFTILDDLKELFMAYADYLWVEDIYSAYDGPIEVMSADGWLLERRNYYFGVVLRRFFEKSF